MDEENGAQPFEVSHPHLKGFKRFLDELNKETERGAALISSAMIDELLNRTILAYLVEHERSESLLTGFNAPLGTFSARIVAAFSLGLLSESEYRECEIIRKIRNAFAHDVHISFSDGRIRNLCSNLDLCAKDYGDVHVDSRGKFTTSAVGIVLNLTNRPHYASRRRLHFRPWPY
jgi:mannitol operon repressor